MILLTKVSYPFVWLLSVSTRLLNKLIGLKSEERPMTQEEIKMILHQKFGTGCDWQEETEMIRDVFRFSDNGLTNWWRIAEISLSFTLMIRRKGRWRQSKKNIIANICWWTNGKMRLSVWFSVKDIILMVGNKKVFNLREIARPPLLYFRKVLYANKSFRAI